MKRQALLAGLFIALFSLRIAAQSPDWPNPGNDKAGTRYSTLDQINRDNVTRLQVAWTYHTKDAAEGTTIECTPLVIDGVAYVTTVRTRIAALDAATGKEIWSFDPYQNDTTQRIRASGGVNRGVAFWLEYRPWEIHPNPGPPAARVIVGLADGRLLSLDAKTGKPDPDFGTGGYVDLRGGYMPARDLSKEAYGPTSPPAVFQNLVIVGCSNNEGHPAAPGDVRAFDAKTGKEIWRFHTIPQPGEPLYETWPQLDAWKGRGGANPWGGFTVDEKNGIVFCGTGSAGPDFFGAGRKGDNVFANCVLALDASTGRRLWHFQTIRHDLWDHDIPCPPVVVTVEHDGRKIDAVAQVTKTGHCWLLDRKTGAPLFGAQDVPAPPSDIPGEAAAASQPIPLKPPPFSRQHFTPEEATNLSPEANKAVLEKLKGYRHDGPHAPPSTRGTVIIPGFHGGATWSGASYDPTLNYLYVNSNDAPYVGTLKEVPTRPRTTTQGSPRAFAAASTQPTHYEPTGYHYFRDGQPLPKEREQAGGQQGGYPAIKPPWGTLSAINLNTGEFAWQVRLGEFPELTAKDIPQTGTESFGGTIVTQGGLVFIGGTKDEMFHAFDAKTGKLLWRTKLPAGGYATPSTYMAKGKQYVLIAAGGGGKQRTKSGDTFVAFALP
jgi:quinoprotein glucose dehydrogenase